MIKISSHKFSFGIILLTLFIITFSIISGLGLSKLGDTPKIKIPCVGMNCTIILDKVQELAKYQIYNTFEVSGNLVHVKTRIEYYISPPSNMSFCRRMISQKEDDLRIFDVFIFKNGEQIAFKPYLDFYYDENDKKIANFPCYKFKANDTILIDYFIGGKIDPETYRFLSSNLVLSEKFYPFDKYSFESWNALDQVYYNRVDKLVLPDSFVLLEEESMDSCPCAWKFGMMTTKLNITTNETIESPLFQFYIFGDWYVYEGGGKGDFIIEGNKRVIVWPTLSSGPLDEMKSINPARYNFSVNTWDDIYDYRTGCYLNAKFERTGIIKYFFFISVLLITLASIYFLWFYRSDEINNKDRLYKTFGSSFIIWSFQEGLSSLTPLIRPTSFTLFDSTLFIPIIFFIIYKSKLVDFFKEKTILRWKKLDYSIFFVIVPAILLSIFLLPNAIKNTLILLPSNPTIISAFFSNYTHSDLSHIITNLIGYTIVVFLLFHLETNKKFFYTNSFLIFIALPIISSSFIIYLVPKIPPVQGFSAIVSGFIGYLLYSVYNFVKNVYKITFNYSFIFLLLMINFLIFSTLASINYLILITIIVSIFLIYMNRKNIIELFKKSIGNYKNLLNKSYLERVYGIYVFVLVVFFIFSLFTLIPQDIREGNKLVNILSHYVGYVFGVFVPLLLDKLRAISIKIEHKEKS